MLCVVHSIVRKCNRKNMFFSRVNGIYVFMMCIYYLRKIYDLLKNNVCFAIFDNQIKKLKDKWVENHREGVIM